MLNSIADSVDLDEDDVDDEVRVEQLSSPNLVGRYFVFPGTQCMFITFQSC